VRRRNRDPARLLFRRRVDRVVRLELAAKTLRADLRQRRRQRRLAVVHVTNRAHVHVGLGALELTLCHVLLLSKFDLNACQNDLNALPRGEAGRSRRRISSS
jgi:hypothetical protein